MLTAPSHDILALIDGTLAKIREAEMTDGITDELDDVVIIPGNPTIIENKTQCMLAVALKRNGDKVIIDLQPKQKKELDGQPHLQIGDDELWGPYQLSLSSYVIHLQPELFAHPSDVTVMKRDYGYGNQQLYVANMTSQSLIMEFQQPGGDLCVTAGPNQVHRWKLTRSTLQFNDKYLERNRVYKLEGDTLRRLPATQFDMEYIETLAVDLEDRKSVV